MQRRILLVIYWVVYRIDRKVVELGMEDGRLDGGVSEGYVVGVIWLIDCYWCCFRQSQVLDINIIVIMRVINCVCVIFFKVLIQSI